ncbi:NIPSNAP family protein [Ralstonia pickettii]|uniref:NIPSNAP family protein n=1 Tax=Cupriavidus sp. DF5525 TaxID=3160989 RepID=UPI0003B027EC|nr:hypothetical protein N234_09385 [Ralstonia pickettii DTP0602]
MKEYLSLYEREGAPIQTQVLHLLGHSSPDTGVLHQVIHLWAYDSMEDRARKRAQLRDAPGWKEYAAKVS